MFPRLQEKTKITKHKYQIGQISTGQISDRTNTRKDKYQTGKTPDRPNIRQDKHQIGKTPDNVII